MNNFFQNLGKNIDTFLQEVTDAIPEKKETFQKELLKAEKELEENLKNLKDYLEKATDSEKTDPEYKIFKIRIKNDNGGLVVSIKKNIRISKRLGEDFFDIKLKKKVSYDDKKEIMNSLRYDRENEILFVTVKKKLLKKRD